MNAPLESLIAVLKDPMTFDREEAAKALGAITGQDFGENQERWQQWRDENRE